MKTIALFGATGKTGSAFLKIALENNYYVKALVRTPQKITISHPNLEIIHGDVLNPNHVLPTIRNTNLVVSLFGHVKNSPACLQTNGTKNIVTAMEQTGVEKIISLLGGGLPFPEKDRPKLTDLMIRGIMKLVVPKILNDAIAHYEVLKNSDKTWIIVRGPRLTNEPKKGKYRVGWVGVNASTSIGREDLADFILKQVEDTQFHFQMPFVSY
jgi:putative NADH-flavin reductase